MKLPLIVPLSYVAVCLTGLAVGAPQAAIAADMRLQWKLDLPTRKLAWVNTQQMRRDMAYPLIVQRDLVMIGCEHNGAVVAVDLATGDERWRFYTGAPVRVAPASDGKCLFVTSDDGYPLRWIALV